MGFKALNERSEGDNVAQETSEAQEARIMGAYESAMNYVAKGNTQDGIVNLQSILAEEVVQDAKNPRSKAPTMRIRQIRFLVVKNLAGLLSKEDESIPEALQHYQDALSLDPRDGSLWTKLGLLASETCQWGLARYAYEKSLLLGARSVMLAEKLLEVLIQIGDDKAALYITEHLQKLNPGHPRAKHVATLLKDPGNAPKRFTVALQSFSSEPLLTANIPKKRLDLNEDRMGAKKASQARLDVKDCTWESFLDALLQALKSPSDKDSSEVHDRGLQIHIDGKPLSVLLHQRRERIEAEIIEPTNTHFEKTKENEKQEQDILSKISDPALMNGNVPSYQATEREAQNSVLDIKIMKDGEDVLMTPSDGPQKKPEEGPETKRNQEDSQLKKSEAIPQNEAGNGEKVSKRSRKARAMFKETSVVGNEPVSKQQGKRRNLVATIQPYIGPRVSGLYPQTQVSHSQAQENPNLGDSTSNNKLDNNLPDLLDFLNREKTRCSIVSLGIATIETLSSEEIRADQASSLLRKLAQLDTFIRGCEVTISGCMMLAELHIAYASQISEKLKGRLRSSGKAMQAEFRESQTHTQYAQARIGEVFKQMHGKSGGKEEFSRNLALRCFWARGKMAEHAGNAKESEECFSMCKTLCQGSIQIEQNGDSSTAKACVRLSHLEKDAIISKESATKKLEDAQIKKVVEGGAELVVEEKTQEVIAQVAPTCLNTNSSLDKATLIRGLQLLKDLLVRANQEKQFALQLHVRMAFLNAKLRKIGEDAENTALHQGIPRGKKPPKGVFGPKEIEEDGTVTWVTKPADAQEMLKLAHDIEDFKEANAGQDNSISEDLGKFQSEAFQQSLHNLQWKLLCYAERCYWAASNRKIPTNTKDKGYREGLVASLTALTSLQKLDKSFDKPLTESLGHYMEILSERHCSHVLDCAFLNLCLLRLQESLRVDSDDDEHVERCQAIIAQCLYLKFGLDIPNRDKTWGGESQEVEVQLSNSRDCLQVWPYIASYAKHIQHDAANLATLQSVLELVSSILGAPPESLQNNSSIDYLLNHESISADNLLDDESKSHLHQLLEPSQELAALVKEDAHSEVNKALLGFKVVIAAFKLDLKDKVLKESGITQIENVLKLAKQHLSYLPLNYTTWDCLARTFQQAYSGLLEELSRNVSFGQESMKLIEDARRRTLRTTIIVRGLVPSEEEERSYAEEALGTFLLSETKDLPPLYDQIQKKPCLEVCKWYSSRAGQAFERAALASPEEWSFQHQLGFAHQACRANPEIFLQEFAKANHLAKSLMGGRIEPLFSLHAARLDLVQTGHKNYKLLCKYCFTEECKKRLASILGGSPQHQSETAITDLTENSRNEDDHQSKNDGRKRSSDAAFGYQPDLESESKRAKLDAILPEAQHTKDLDPNTESTLDESQDLQARQAIQDDCTAAFKFCLSWSKIFHKARFQLAKLCQDPKAAVQEMRPLFSKGRKLFDIHVDYIQDADDMVYRSGEQQEQEIKKALSHSDESEWGKPPNKMAGTGLTEDEREHQAHIRRYLHYYLHLLVQADDIEHLQAASQALSQPSIHTSHPGLKDLARLALSLHVWKLASNLHQASTENVLATLQISSRDAHRYWLSLKEDAKLQILQSLEASWHLFAEYGLKSDTLKVPSWNESIVGIVKSCEEVSVLASQEEWISEQAFMNYAKGYIQLLEMLQEPELLSNGVAMKMLKRKGEISGMVLGFYSSFVQACSTLMVVCLQDIEECASEYSELSLKVKDLNAIDSSWELVDYIHKGIDEGGEIVFETIQDPTLEAAITESKQSSERKASEAFQKLKVLYNLYKGIEQSQKTVKELEVDSADSNALLVTAVAAYTQALLDGPEEIGEMDVKEAISVMDEMIKQSGKSTIAPCPQNLAQLLPKGTSTAIDMPMPDVSIQTAL